MRPWSTSDRVERTANANVARKELSVKAVMVGFVIWNFSATCGSAGAIIELDSGGMNV